jgi:LPXTG-site transpeptidase (sortase) family protein
MNQQPRDLRLRPLPGQERPARRVLGWLRRLSVLSGLALIVVGVLWAISYMSTPALMLEYPNGPQPISAYAATHSSPPCHTPGVKTGLWVEIPSLGIDLPIQEGDGSNNIPDCVALHYPGTAQPGQDGNSYVYAHGLMGMFGPLLWAHDGEQVILQDYTAHTTTVMHIDRVVGRVAYNDVSWIHEQSTTPLLTLQTCIGANWNTDRWIVQAT